MKKHKKDRYETSPVEKKKKKEKSKKKERKVQKLIVSSDSISNKQSYYYRSPKKIKEVNINVNKHFDKEEVSEEVAYILKKNTTTKTIKNSLPMNIKEYYKSSSFIEKEMSPKKCDRVKMVNNFFNSNVKPYLSEEKLFNISLQNKEYTKSRSQSKSRSKSISKSKLNLYYCKHSSKILHKRSTFYENSRLKKSIVSCEYEKSTSPDKFKISYASKNIVSPEINLNSNKYSKSSQKSKSRSKLHSSKFMLRYSPLQRHYDHYVDILNEVKKILQKDVISKRKLKYIFKRKRVYMHTPNKNFQTVVNNDLFVPKNNLKEDTQIDSQIELNSLECISSRFSANTYEKLSKICISPVTSSVKNNKVLYSKNNPFNDDSPASEFISNIISRTPSPTLPLVTKETAFNNTLETKKLRRLSLVSQINLSENSSKYDFQISNNYENTDVLSKILTIENNSLNTTTSTTTSSNTLSNSLLCHKKKDLSFSKENDISDINVKETFSFYKLSSNSPSLSRSSTPLKNLTDYSSWQQFVLLDNSPSNSVLKNEFLSNAESNINAIQSTPSKTSQISELSKTEASSLKQSLEDLDRRYRLRSRSISFSKTSRSLSRSLSRSSEHLRQRSCSKSSIDTFKSSTDRTRSTYSCSSHSSTLSSRISRSHSSNSSRSRSTSIPRRHGSPSFLDRRRITSARKRPIPYHRPTPSPLSSSSSAYRSNYNVWSPHSYRSSRTPSCSPSYLIS